VVEAISPQQTLLEEAGAIFVVVAAVAAALETMVAGAIEPPSRCIKDKEGLATN
jgi:hypothetical protein